MDGWKSALSSKTEGGGGSPREGGVEITTRVQPCPILVGPKREKRELWKTTDTIKLAKEKCMRVVRPRRKNFRRLSTIEPTNVSQLQDTTTIRNTEKR